jgi:hypothetical protein
LLFRGIWRPHVYYGLEQHSDGAFAFEPSKQITHPDYSEDLGAEVVAHYRANGDCAMLAAAMAEEIRTD